MFKICNKFSPEIVSKEDITKFKTNWQTTFFKGFLYVRQTYGRIIEKTDNKDVDAVRVDNQQVYKLIQIKCTVQVGMATGTRTESGLEIS